MDSGIKWPCRSLDGGNHYLCLTQGLLVTDLPGPENALFQIISLPSLLPPSIPRFPSIPSSLSLLLSLFTALALLVLQVKQRLYHPREPVVVLLLPLTFILHNVQKCYYSSLYLSYTMYRSVTTAPDIYPTQCTEVLLQLFIFILHNVQKCYYSP